MPEALSPEQGPAREPAAPAKQAEAAAEGSDVSERTLRGRVFGPQRGPVAGALVALQQTRNGAPFSSVRHATAETDSSGAFQLEVPALSSISVTASYLNGEAVKKTVTSPAAGQMLDVFVVDAVPLNEGRYEVLLDPRESQGIGRFITPERRSVELPKAGDVSLEYPLSFGARCEVQLGSSKREPWSAGVRLRDDDGRVRMSSSFISSGEDDPECGITLPGFFDVSRQGAASLARFRGVLPPGEYTIEVKSKQHATWTGTVTVESRKVAKAQAELKPEAQPQLPSRYRAWR